MARPELGTKRIDPENGRKLYDLGKNPIVSPYTGASYATSFFDPPASAPSRRAAPRHGHREDEPAAEVENDEEDVEAQVVSLDSIEDGEAEAAKLPNEDVDGDEDDETSEETDGDDSRILPLDDDDAELEEIARPRDDE